VPGIAGFIGVEARDERATRLAEMIRTMAHEPFYGSGTLEVDQLGLAVGWTHHNGSYAECFPAWNATKDICLVFSGEHFDHVRQHETRHTSQSSSRCSTATLLLQQYEQRGQAFLLSLNGCFSGLLIDLRGKQTALLFNDRYGLGRIYYHEATGGGFFFASEAKALLKVFPHLRRLDHDALGEFLACGTTLQNRTLFPEMFLLPGGSVWTFTRDLRTHRSVYFERRHWEQQPSLPLEDYYHRLKDTFRRILPRYLSGQRPIGLSLTGGIDSRLILAWFPEAQHVLRAYTFGGLYRKSADVAIAERVAGACKLPHDVITLDRRFFAEFPRLATRSVCLTDGTMDVTGAVGLYVNNKARDISPIRLTGNYGGQVLRGSIPFKCGTVGHSIYSADVVDSARRAHTTFATERADHPTSFILFRQVPWHHYPRFCLEQTQLVVRTPYLDNELAALAYQAPPDSSVNKMLLYRLIHDGNPALARLPSDRGTRGRADKPPSRLRVFFEEFLPRLEYMYDYGMPPWLAHIDYFLRPLHLERVVLGLQKYYHFRVWYRDELSDYVKSVLLDASSLARPYLRRRGVEKAVMAHTRGHGNFTIEIHRLLTLELIHRYLVERVS
jgi:asparagine synthase (glutamine-hydrolysing)